MGPLTTPSLHDPNYFRFYFKSSRAAKWLVGLAAFALVSVSIAGYFYHQFQMAAIAADHLRLMVIGPSALQSGAAAQFDITTTEVTGAPISIPVRSLIFIPTASSFGARQESTDKQGRLPVTIRPTCLFHLHHHKGSGLVSWLDAKRRPLHWGGSIREI